jgi:hypothetical protein
MTLVVIGCLLLLLLLVGPSAFRTLGRFARGNWRPGAGMMALAAFIAAAGFGIRESWAVSLVLSMVGIMLSMSVRRIGRPKPSASGEAPPPRRRRGGMSPEEARDILGVGPDASADEVQAAYLRLIRRNHPDQGGSTGLAAQLNAARDVLVGKK